MKKVDMSSEAITRRLRQASELRDLCLALQKANAASEKKRRLDGNNQADKKRNPLKNATEAT
ncbi:MAG TPA: hypothetical protein DEA22_01045 [Blastocatellia bacterium]|nr:hypothetical protein [Blastocatellia bacterium]